jgi:hypothetical protein
MEISELEDRVSTLEQYVDGRESSGLRSDIQMIGEAINIIRRILTDLVAASNVELEEYAEDLDRLDAIEKFMIYSS